MRKPWLKFYPSDWRGDPKLRMCGLAARGLWIEMIGLMHEAQPYGHLVVAGERPTDTQLAVLVGTAADRIPGLIGELESADVFSRNQEGVIYSRRLTRDEKRAKAGRKSINKRWGEAAVNKQQNRSPNRGSNSPPSTQRPEARGQRPESKKSILVNEGFEEWWEKVPKKVGKGGARVAYNTARRKADAEILLIGIQVYAGAMKGKESQFIAHPKTWLNQERWLDEHLENAGKSSGDSEFDKAMASADSTARRFEN